MTFNEEYNIYILTPDESEFPRPEEALLSDEIEEFAVGGNVLPDSLWNAYSNGIFPWYAYKEYPYPVWFCPKQRFVIFPESVHISHSMRTMINSGRYRATFDRAFEDVIRNCSSVDGRDKEDGAWLGGRLMESMIELHRRGIAHSVEVWENDRLVGGLYGIWVNRCFCGDSMFSKAPSASKFALISLAGLLKGKNVIIDAQIENPYLLSMGGVHIPFPEYQSYLYNAPALPFPQE